MATTPAPEGAGRLRVEFLSDGENGYLVLGCMNKDEAYAIPRAEIQKLLPFLNTTTPQTGDVYWHLHIADRTGTSEFMVPKQANNLSLRPFTFTMDAKKVGAVTSAA